MKLAILKRYPLPAVAVLSLGLMVTWQAGLLHIFEMMSYGQNEKTADSLATRTQNKNGPSTTKLGSVNSENQPASKTNPSPEMSVEHLFQNGHQFLKENSIKAKIRQRGFLFEKQVISAGTVLHAGGPKPKTRIEMVMQTSNRNLNVKLVNDGVYFFRQVFADSPHKKQSDVKQKSAQNDVIVQRINLRQVEDRLNKNQMWPGQWIGHGSLLHFFEQIDASFQFAAPQQTTIADQPAWMVRGVWKPEKLAILIPDQRETILRDSTVNLRNIPPQIPIEVEVYFHSDGPLKFFPFRTVFYRPSEELLEGIKQVPILVTEYSEAEVVPVPPHSDFQFNANENEVFDITDSFIRSFTQQ